MFVCEFAFFLQCVCVLVVCSYTVCVCVCEILLMAQRHGVDLIIVKPPPAIHKGTDGQQ